jgi:hypothetical protein
MNTLAPTHERMRDVCLDALAAICASERGDYASVSVLVNATSDAELREFLVAVIGHGGQLLRLAAHESGVGPDKIAGAVAASIRERTS